MKEMIEGLMINNKRNKRGCNNEYIINSRYTLLTTTRSSGEDKWIISPLIITVRYIAHRNMIILRGKNQNGE